MRRKFFMFFLVILLATALSAVSLIAQEEDLKTYSNTYFSLKYNPKVWIFTPEEGEVSSVSLKYNIVEQSATLDAQTGILIQANRSTDPMSLEDIKKLSKMIIEGSWPNAVVLSMKDVENCGALGIENVFTADFAEARCKAIQQIYRKDKNVYMITILAKEKEFDKAKPLFDAVMKTFTVK